MAPLKYSSVFGGNPASGDAASPNGFDCIIHIGGGPEIYEIDQIIATYAVVGGIDYDNPDLFGFRSFTGRLSVVEGIVDRQLSFPGGGTVNTQLTQPYPSDVGKIVFDCIFNEFNDPRTFNFPRNEGYGSLTTESGKGLSVILLAATGYNHAGQAASFTTQMLHVHANKISDEQDIRLGAYHVRG